MNKIAIGLSGGVDSSVAAHLLKSKGHEVIGVFMRFWHDDNPACSGCIENKCCNEDSFRKAKRLCIKLDIPLKVFDFQDEFKKAVVDNFVEYYTQGKTPNPCIWCNEEIKFKLFYEKARQVLNIDFIATGHYADIVNKDSHHYIKKASDPTKDQSYFLYRIPQGILSKIKFPLANLDKSEVKKIAQQQFPDLNFDKQKESQDLCFVSDDYKQFVSKHSDDLSKPGDIATIDGGVIGKHNGLINYTIGQRKGITEGGGVVYYVKEIDTKNNKLIVAEHNQLLSERIQISNIITSPLLSSSTESLQGDSDRGSRKNILSAKIRYNTPPAECKISFKKSNSISPLEKGAESESSSVSGVVNHYNKEKSLQVNFNQPQFAPTPGQHCVIYQNNLVIGGGEIV